MNDKETAEQLVNKWIARESRYRAKAAVSRRAGRTFTTMEALADQLNECRRELQEAFGLVTQP